MGLDFSTLNNMHLDVLREIGNIGAGNAVTALAKMIDKKVDMGVPHVRILEFKEVSNVLGGEEKIFVGILLNVTGDLTGNMMFMLDLNAARSLLNMLMGKNVTTDEVFDEIEISALKEIGNILTGSYLSALSTLSNLNILPTIPDIAIDMAGALLSVPAIEFGKVGDTVLYIETEFKEGNDIVVGDFFLVPDMQSYEILLKALGVI